MKNAVLNAFFRNKNRALTVLRRLGWYRGPIHHRVYVDVGRIGVTGKGI